MTGSGSGNASDYLVTGGLQTSAMFVLLRARVIIYPSVLEIGFHFYSSYIVVASIFLANTVRSNKLFF